VLNEGELESLLKDSKLKPKVLSTYFDIRKGLDGSLDRTIKALCEEADAAVRSGCQLLVLSDRSEAPVSTFLLKLLVQYLKAAIFSNYQVSQTSLCFK
jgi:glutamate synthase (ferredoxin)